MLLILTHENADFDAVASQLAAHKLYSDGVPLLSQRINRNVHQFLTLYWDGLPFMRREDWQRQKVDSVLLVDTQSFNSVRGMVRHPKVHVIDHHDQHLRHENWRYDLAKTGATTTILIEKLHALGLRLTPEEATLLLLGIYEDTGALTYDTTTARDMRAAVWLHEQGARLNIVRQFMKVALTAAQQTLYDALHQNVTWVEPAGQPVAIATARADADFEDEISSVAHRLRDVLSPAALLVLVQIGRDVQLVARSSSDHVDVSRIAQALGGGGHSKAAAALITPGILSQIKERVLLLLPQVVTPLTAVAEIMSYGVQTLTPETTIEEALALMQRFGYEGYPIVSEETGLVGLLTRRAVDRAINHDLGRLPVTRIMKAGKVTVHPGDSIERVQQLMLAEGWGQIPVVAATEANGETNSAPIGIVTRTDLLNHLFRTQPDTAVPDMRKLLAQALPRPLWGMVLAASTVAAEQQQPLYFVGGLVRDLLLGHEPVDLDMVVEGDAIRLVRALQATYGGEVHTHERFGTAKWFVGEGIWQQVTAEVDRVEGETAVEPVELPAALDFVTARTEFYTEPSALPRVERGSIKLDLHRRDFTLNTLAVRLDGDHLGHMLDFYGGLRDLENGQIRVLHSLSFVDDPTRILRAIRLAARLNFEIELRTAELLRSSLPMLERVTGARIRHEIELALREAQPGHILAEFDAWEVLAHIHPALTWTRKNVQAFKRLPPLLAETRWQAVLGDESPVFPYFALWLAPLPAETQAAVLERLHVRKTTRADLALVGRAQQALSKLPSGAAPGEVERALRPFHGRVLLVCRVLATKPHQVAFIERYYWEWRHVATELDGHTLQEMGLRPGPIFARLLDELLAARLDGRVTTEAEERALAAALVEAYEASGELQRPF